MKGTRRASIRARFTRAWRSRDGESGQLLLLAGILLALAFVTTAITLSHVSDLDRQITADQRAPVMTEYRFLRTMAGGTLDDAVTPSMTVEEFKETFESMRSMLIAMAQDKGYELSIDLAGEDSGLPVTEWNYTSAGWPLRNETAAAEWYNGGVPFPDAMSVPDPDYLDYWLFSHDGRLRVGPAASGGQVQVSWDEDDDGIVVFESCLHPGESGACIQAAIVHLRLENEETVIEEYVVYALNL